MNLRYTYKEYGESKKVPIQIPWITLRKNPLDEYWDLESKKDENLPNHKGYIFTPDCVYEVKPENIYVQGTKHRYVVKGELKRHEYKNMKNMKYYDNEFGDINISQLIIDYVNGQFRFWSSAQYHDGKKWTEELRNKCVKLVI